MCRLQVDFCSVLDNTENNCRNGTFDQVVGPVFSAGRCASGLSYERFAAWFPPRRLTCSYSRDPWIGGVTQEYAEGV
jgi:hypothetical protein